MVNNSTNINKQTIISHRNSLNTKKNTHYIVAVKFAGGGTRSTLRKPPTCRKSLTTRIRFTTTLVHNSQYSPSGVICLNYLSTIWFVLPIVETHKLPTSQYLQKKQPFGILDILSIYYMAIVYKCCCKTYSSSQWLLSHTISRLVIVVTYVWYLILL
jgi:hypothetical protein